jgi:integrase
MSGRRAHGLGAVYKRKSDGKWVGVVDGGYIDGKRQRKAYYGDSEREVLAKVSAARREREDGLSIVGREQPLEKYVAAWLAQRDPRSPSAGVRQLRWNTWAGYERRLRLHVLPVIGSMQLGQIRPDHVRRVLAKMAESKLSATTIACTRDTLATVLERAVKDRVLPHNPVSAVDSVQRSKPHRYTLTAEQAGAFLRAAEGDPLEAVFVVTLHAGLRQSEVLGLQWEDVNLDRAELAIRRALVRVKGRGLQTNDPKTDASAVVVPIGVRAVAALRAHKERLVAQNRLPAGFVFSTGNGTPISASNMLRSSFYPICERADIPTRPGLRFHDLRHSAGSLLIQAGVRPKDVQAILRHAKVSTTMDLYVHSYDDDLRSAVAKLGAAIG